MTKLTLAALALVALATPALANVSIEDQRTHPGIVVGPSLDFYLKQPAPPFGTLAPLDESNLPPPPPASTDPWWVPAKRVGV